MKGSLGNTDADIVRNIVLAWLAEKSFISEEGKRKVNQDGSSEG